MKDPADTIKRLWAVANNLGFKRDGASDEGRLGSLKVLIGYGCGAVRVRLFAEGRPVSTTDVANEDQFALATRRMMTLAGTAGVTVCERVDG